MQRELHDGDYFDTIVIGGGQTGLAVGYELKQRGREFVILDAADRVGEAWRKRWDSLLVFTPARYLGLPGLKFPAKGDSFVGKEAVADYLEHYAGYHDMPISLSTPVTRLGQDDGGYIVESGDLTLRAGNVIVAMANYQVPKVPPFAPDLDPEIVQMHSSQYKNPSQLQEGPVLVVGMGNSGADIGIEVAKTHETYVAGKESAAIPFRIEPWIGRNVLARLVRFVMLHVLNTSTPIGRRRRPKSLKEAAPLVRVKPKDLEEATHRVGRVMGVTDGKPVIDDGRRLDVANVIWCTGFVNGFSWLDLPSTTPDGLPEHDRGVVDGYPGLYFCGHHFLYSAWSETLTGMIPDARYIVNHLAAHTKETTRQHV